jgi:hypothetical protein
VAATKTCSCCDRDLPVSAFGRSKATRSGLQSWCRECKAAGWRTWYRSKRRRDVTIPRSMSVRARKRMIEGIMEQFGVDWEAAAEMLLLTTLRAMRAG